MLKKEMQSRYDEGKGKTELFEDLVEQGYREKAVANVLASLKDKTLCALHETKNNILITIMFFQAAFGAFFGYQSAIENNLSPYFFASLGAFVPMLFIYGFYRFHPVAYQAFILLAILGLPSQLGAFAEGSLEGIISTTISLCLLAYVWHLKTRLYPDLGLLGAKKPQGQYRFAN